MDWLKPIDNYCERTSATLFGEPLNLISNLAFIIVGFYCLRRNQRRSHDRLTLPIAVLGCLIVVVGIGSSLFHSLANVWSMWADVAPIAIFLLAFISVYVRYELQRSWKTASYSLGIFLAGSGLIAWPLTGRVNGSEAYFGTAVTLLMFAAIEYRRLKLQVHQSPSSSSVAYFLAAAAVFSASLTFRSLDQWICPQFSLGTHFLWHIFNGLVILLAMQVLLTSRSSSV